MRIFINAIGRIKQCPENDIIAKYNRRLTNPIIIKEFEEKRNISGEKLKIAEGKLLLSAIDAKTKTIVLDEIGKNMNSLEFADYIKGCEDSGVRNLAFLIGGANGHSREVKEKADLILSLGKMTWPHMMVRAMLTEQIYRAYSINSGHPYHKC